MLGIWQNLDKPRHKHSHSLGLSISSTKKVWYKWWSKLFPIWNTKDLCTSFEPKHQNKFDCPPFLGTTSIQEWKLKIPSFLLKHCPSLDILGWSNACSLYFQLILSTQLLFFLFTSQSSKGWYAWKLIKTHDYALTLCSIY